MCSVITSAQVCKPVITKLQNSWLIINFLLTRESEFACLLNKHLSSGAAAINLAGLVVFHACERVHAVLQVHAKPRQDYRNPHSGAKAVPIIWLVPIRSLLVLKVGPVSLAGAGARRAGLQGHIGPWQARGKGRAKERRNFNGNMTSTLPSSSLE